ncbi:MAG: protein phosphatase 2C domain-containing protein [Caldilineaceae bacterium]|nr:protein phosphatase 2C domain-containing protein [Caldilineaceae bacterium]
MSREPSSIDPEQDGESSAKDKIVQVSKKVREEFTPRYGADGPPQGNPSEPEHTTSAEPRRDPSRDYGKSGTLDDQNPSPGGEVEAPLDEESVAAPPDESGVRSEQDHTEDEDVTAQSVEMAEPHIKDSGPSDKMSGEACPTEPTDLLSDVKDPPDVIVAGPADIEQSTSEQEVGPEPGARDQLNGDDATDFPPHDGETFSDEGDAGINGPDPHSFAGEDYLEEEILEPRSEDGSLKPGVLHMMGDVHYKVTECLPRGYYRGHKELEDETKSVLFHLSPLNHRDRWREAGSGHRMLPEIRYEGADGHVLEDIEGQPVGTGLSLQQALQPLDGIRQLMRFLSVRCRVVVTDICIEGLVHTTDAGLRLRYLPALAPMDEPAHVSCSDGVTPIEGSETEKASERTSVFLWGAMLHALVTGEPLSAEGLDTNALARLREPGLPQLLAATLEQQHPCPDLRTLRDICRDFMVAPAPRYMVGAATTVGLNPDRLCNEDSYGAVHSQCEYHDSRPQLVRACVADGMGGEEAGEVASKAAVDAFCHAPAPASFSEAEEQIRWTRSLGWTANRAVLDALGGSGGGCTLTGVVVVDDRLALAHVGDSRAYLHSRERGLQLLSRDHSQIKALLDSGLITEDEAAASEDTNQILRALGDGRQDVLAEEYVDTLDGLKDPAGSPVHGETLKLQVDDLVLLMSDGIWGSWEYRESVISDALCQVITEADREPQAVADALVRAALEAGADDNATIVVLKRVG